MVSLDAEGLFSRTPFFSLSFIFSRLYEYSMLPCLPDTPISGHFDFTILYFVVKTKQIRTIRSEDLSTSLLSSVLFAAELRFV